MKKVGIIGCGLIGGSIGLALKDIGWEITGIGRDMERLKEALRMGAVDNITVNLEEGLKDMEIVIVATPVKAILEITPKLSSYLKKGTIITDVGSTKEKITHSLTPFFENKGIHFVGAHPLAGRELSGIKAAKRDLFYGKVCILTPIQKTDKKALSLVREMWEGMGTKVIEMSPSQHDRFIGLTSHLPHLIAMELVGIVSEYEKEYPGLESLIGTGFKDTTRIAKSSPDMWRDICLTNQETLVLLLNRFKERLEELCSLIKKGEEGKLWERLLKAKEWRSGIP